MQIAKMITVAVCFAIFMTGQSLAATAPTELTKACKKIVGQDALFEESDADITIISRGDINFTVRDIRINSAINGLLFEADGRSIIHCTEWMIIPELILVEEETEYSLFLLDEFISTRFYIHNKVNCGVSCYSSRVDTVVIPVSNEFEPRGYMELESTLYDYPSKWFRAYLTDAEKLVLDKTYH